MGCPHVALTRSSVVAWRFLAFPLWRGFSTNPSSGSPKVVGCGGIYNCCGGSLNLKAAASAADSPFLTIASLLFLRGIIGIIRIIRKIARYGKKCIFCIMWQMGGPRCVQNTPTRCGNDLPTLLRTFTFDRKCVLWDKNCMLTFCIETLALLYVWSKVLRAKWPYGPWDHFMVFMKGSLWHAIY